MYRESFSVLAKGTCEQGSPRVIPESQNALCPSSFSDAYHPPIGAPWT